MADSEGEEAQPAARLVRWTAVAGDAGAGRMDDAGRADRTLDGPRPADARLPDAVREKPFVAFDRMELNEILKIYGRMVAIGEWRDYAIDHLADRAVFSIFRRASEVPLYRIEKTPRLARKQGAYAVIAQTGMILKRGPELARVLRVIDKASLHVAV